MGRRVVLTYITGGSCEDCIYFNDEKKCKSKRCRKCGESRFYQYEGGGNLDSKCASCEYFSQIGNYKPHCRYEGKKKSPIVQNGFICPITKKAIKWIEQ